MASDSVHSMVRLIFIQVIKYVVMKHNRRTVCVAYPLVSLYKTDQMYLIANYREPVSKGLGITSLPESFQVKAFLHFFCNYKRGLPVKKMAFSLKIFNLVTS